MISESEMFYSIYIILVGLLAFLQAKYVMRATKLLKISNTVKRIRYLSWRSITGFSSMM